MTDPILNKILTEWNNSVHKIKTDHGHSIDLNEDYHMALLDEIIGNIDAPPGFKIRMMNRMRGLTEAACGPGQNPKRDGCVAADGSSGSGKSAEEEPKKKKER